MRLPRLRFSIGLMMAAVLAAGVGLWAVLIVRPRLIEAQLIVVSQAEASYKQAKLVREVAEYAVKEYLEGAYPQDQATIRGQIALARVEQQRALDRLQWSIKMRGGLVTPPTNIADELAKQKADFDLEQAQVQLKVLEHYTKAKQTKSLTSDVEKARADEKSRLDSYQREKSRLYWLGR